MTVMGLWLLALALVLVLHVNSESHVSMSILTALASVIQVITSGFIEYIEKLLDYVGEMPTHNKGSIQNHGEKMLKP